ncbi:MAG: spondin domain-containing protein [Methylococcaceae bacterium]
MTANFTTTQPVITDSQPKLKPSYFKANAYKYKLCANLIVLLLGLSVNSAYADREYYANYEVTVSNITHGEFAAEGDRCRTGPLMGFFVFATHQVDFNLFELGKPASGELATLAETGAPFVLAGTLAANPKISQAFSIPALQDFPAKLFDGILCAGEQLKTSIWARPGHRFSMAAMLFPSNDAFLALNNVELPTAHSAKTYYSPAYDAGSESNDELCANMPNSFGLPGCQSPTDGNSNPTIPDPNNTGGPGLGEGYVHIHSGIQGIGDLKPKEFSWNNPVARITIRRVR